MKRTNKFSGISLKYSTVFTYFRNNNFPDFDHFVFQQMIDDDGNATGDNFTLAAYAVNKDLSVLNNGNPLPNDEMDASGVLGIKPGIQFANMRLDKNALTELYKSATSALSVYPPGPPITYYKNTSYVQYVAQTKDSQDVVTVAKVDPSPPA